MPRPKSEPLTLAQQATIYDTYTKWTSSPLIPGASKTTMLSLAQSYRVSVSVIHRAIHNEAFRRGEADC